MRLQTEEAYKPFKGKQEYRTAPKTQDDPGRGKPEQLQPRFVSDGA
ncbi:hypothetical protein GCM10010833_33770 [Blastomonas aquatica]|uniref:Uncharacterized protein n=1 Tax=Blastomonas aquatica TaxID=1510276 RepID=A0ABQ1JWA9_9SPHN|nr:hypothetical protein GCM10010833_33770 [Blastomonas aquatica]